MRHTAILLSLVLALAACHHNPVPPVPTPTPKAKPTATAAAPKQSPSALASPSAASNKPLPFQIYSVNQVGTPADQAILNLPWVTGLSIRLAWRDLEKSQGVYNWTYLDSEIGRAKAAGKKVILRIENQGSATPSWVLTGSQTFAATGVGQHTGDSATLWVYWDSFGQAALLSMYQALGARYGSNPTVAIVVVENGSAFSGDWSIPCTSDQVTKWKAAPYNYTTQKFEAACEANIDTLAKAFPNSVITMACGTSRTLDSTPYKACEDLAAYGLAKYGKRWSIQANRLLCQTPLPSAANGTIWQTLAENFGQINLRAQESLPAYGDTSYHDNGGATIDFQTEMDEMLKIAGAYGMVSLEWYQGDIEHMQSPQ